MRDLGLREWFALGALAFAMLLGFVFLDPANGDSSGSPGVRLGDPPPSPTPVTPTPAPAEPPRALPAPELWEVTFAALLNGREVPENPRAVPTLDFAFERAPFPDYRDNSWLVRAVAVFPVEPGSYTLTLVHDAAVRIFIDDEEVASQPEPSSGPVEFGTTFTTQARQVVVRIDATDASGPFVIRWKQ